MLWKREKRYESCNCNVCLRTALSSHYVIYGCFSVLEGLPSFCFVKKNVKHAYLSSISLEMYLSVICHFFSCCYNEVEFQVFSKDC